MRDPGRARIGILTGGGDVPGLNSVIRSVVYRGAEIGLDVVGVRRGWAGLTLRRPGADIDGEHTVLLDRETTRAIGRSGGTVLHTSRANPRRIPASDLPDWLPADRRRHLPQTGDAFDLTSVVTDNIDRLGLDCLFVVGGDDTLSFCHVLAAAGVPVIGIPKTMDNDVPGTEYAVGFSSAVTRARELIDRQRTTLASHERIGVFRIFGRDAGFSALYAAYVTSSRCVIPEAPYDLDRLAATLADDWRTDPDRYALVITSEGAIWQGAQLAESGAVDAYGHRHKINVGEVLAQELAGRTGIERITSELTYDLRSGEPDSLDSIVAVTYGNVAMDLFAAGTFGRMVAIQGGRYVDVSLPTDADRPRRVDIARDYSPVRFRPRYDGRIRESMLLATSPSEPADVDGVRG
jgi:6-phosphofructokinase